MCASASRPKSHSRPKSVASAGVDYAVQLPVLPKAGCQLAAVSMNLESLSDAKSWIISEV